MKKILTLIAACVITLSASAQIVSSSSRSITRESAVYPNYNRIYASYNSLTPTTKGSSSSDDTMSGFRAGWLGGWNIVKTIPLYLEAGANVQGNFKSEGEGKYKESVTILKLNVPVSIAYRYSIPNTSIAISPYAGVHLTGNILAQIKADGDTYSMFEGSEGAKRIQFGGQVGVGVTFKTFYLGFEYTPDFTAFEEDTKTPSWSATIGLEF